MTRPKSTVRLEVSSRYPQFKRALHDAVRAGVEAGSIAGAHAARAGMPVGDGRSGVMPGHARDTIQPVTLQTRRRGGTRGGFGSPDPTILWHTLGTKGRRVRKLGNQKAEANRSSLRSSAAGRAVGLRPNPFMRRALVTVAVPVAVATMRRHMSTSRLR